MRPDDPVVLDVVQRSMVARIATLSRGGRPSVNPLYFLVVDGKLWLGTSDWTLAARNVQADERVSLLFEVEHEGDDRPVVQISGRACVRTDEKTRRSYNRGVARRYVLRPSGVGNLLVHVRQLGLRRRYYAQSAEQGRPCVIEVEPIEARILDAP